MSRPHFTQHHQPRPPGQRHQSLSPIGRSQRHGHDSKPAAFRASSGVAACLALSHLARSPKYECPLTVQGDCGESALGADFDEPLRSGETADSAASRETSAIRVCTDATTEGRPTTAPDSSRQSPCAQSFLFCFRRARRVSGFSQWPMAQARN
jgi:hypothetical protein